MNTIPTPIAKYCEVRGFAGRQKREFLQEVFMEYIGDDFPALLRAWKDNDAIELMRIVDHAFKQGLDQHIAEEREAVEANVYGANYG